MFYGTNPILPSETENASAEVFELTARVRDDPDLVGSIPSTIAGQIHHSQGLQIADTAIEQSVQTLRALASKAAWQRAENLAPDQVTTASHLEDCTTRLLAMENQKKHAVEMLISTILKPIEQHEIVAIEAAEEHGHSDDA